MTPENLQAGEWCLCLYRFGSCVISSAANGEYKSRIVSDTMRIVTTTLTNMHFYYKVHAIKRCSQEMSWLRGVRPFRVYEMT